MKAVTKEILPKKKTQTVTNVEAEGVEQLYNVILAKCAQTKTYQLWHHSDASGL